MHIWGYITIHPQTIPIADEVAHTAMMLSRFLGAVYGSMLKPTVDELILVAKYSK